MPSKTASGRPIARRGHAATIHELLTHVAAGEGVVPMVECMARFFPRPDVRYVPIHDLPWSDVALVWRTAGQTRTVREFARITAEVVKAQGGPEAARGHHRLGPARR